MAVQRKKKASKKTSKSTALARVNQGALTLPGGLADEFAEFVNRDRAAAKDAGWQWISTRGSAPIMKLNDQAIGDDKGRVELVVLGSLSANTLYPPYDPQQQQGALCYALADINAPDPVQAAADMAPPADLPGRKSDSCATCRYNAFGSADKGKGKACKNTIRLAALPAGTDYAKAEGVMVSVPPTSLRAWAGYTRPILDGLSRPIQTVVTGLTKVPNEEKAGFSFAFDLGGPIQKEADLRAILVRAKGDAKAALAQPPNLEGADANGKAGGDAPQRRKVVRKKRTAKK